MVSVNLNIEEEKKETTEEWFTELETKQAEQPKKKVAPLTFDSIESARKESKRQEEHWYDFLWFHVPDWIMVLLITVAVLLYAYIGWLVIQLL
jgi:hypothetical protein